MRMSSLLADGASRLQRAQPLLGTYVSIRVEANGQRADTAVSAAFERVGVIQQAMSFHDPDSELSRLNADGSRRPRAVSPSLRRVLSASLALARASDGLFDPTVAARLVERGLLPRPDGRRADPRASWRDVRLQRDGRVYFERPLWLDLGGIAKGYAVDQAVLVLKRHGIASGVVNAGGDLRVFGREETVHLRIPDDPGRALPVLTARDAAIATSAGYFSGHPDVTALIHPQRNASLGQDCSVTVCAPRAIWADALTKAVLAAPQRSDALLRRLRATAMILHRDGSRHQVN